MQSCLGGGWGDFFGFWWVWGEGSVPALIIRSTRRWRTWVHALGGFRVTLLGLGSSVSHISSAAGSTGRQRRWV
jgi:hypothetical protein